MFEIWQFLVDCASTPQADTGNNGCSQARFVHPETALASEYAPGTPVEIRVTSDRCEFALDLSFFWLDAGNGIVVGDGVQFDRLASAAEAEFWSAEFDIPGEGLELYQFAADGPDSNFEPLYTCYPDCSSWLALDVQ